MNPLIVGLMSHRLSVFIRRHVLLIGGVERAAVSRDMFENRSGDYNICSSLAERKLGCLLLMTDVSVHQGRDTSPHARGKLES